MNEELIGLRQRQQPATWEDVEDIELEEVSADEADEGDVISIIVHEEASKEEVEEKVRQRLVERCWWLKEHWRQKGLPTEQFVVNVGDKRVNLFNFGESLDERHLGELQGAIEDCASLDGGEIVGGKIEHILIDDEQPKNTRTGEDMNGYSSREERAVKLYPRALEPVEHRVKGVSNLEGTVIHELAHRVSVDFRNRWSERFGWRMLDTPEELPGGDMRYYKNDNPERCITEYAAIDPGEDICESVVGALRAHGQLDSERRDVIEKELLPDGQQEKLSVSITKKEPDAIELPRISKVEYRTVKKGRMRILND